MSILPRLPIALSLALVLIAVTSAPVVAQLPGHLYGQIFDENGEPLEGVEITITNPEDSSYHKVETSGKNGRYTIFLENSLPAYSLSFKKDGYQPFSIPGVKISARQRTRKNFDMRSAGAAQAAAVAAGEVDPEAAAKGGAMTTYNNGVTAFNAGQYDVAEGAFLAALEKNPELGQAHAALARTYRLSAQHAKAVEEAQKAIDLGIEISDMNQVLYDGYTALGETAKAKESLAMLSQGDPGKAAQNLFNQAAEMYNNGQMAEAKAALEQVLQLDPDHAKANYMMGLVLAGEDPARAKSHLEKFLALAPDDPDAATAQEMIKYLN